MDDELRALLQQTKRAKAKALATAPSSSASATAPAPNKPPRAAAAAPSPQPAPAAAATAAGDALVPFRLQHRKTSSDELRTLLGGRPVVQLRQVARLVRNGWPADLAVVGVLAGRTGPKRGNSGNEFILWTLDDLEGHAVQVYLFGSACQGARNVEVGMVCLLTDPLMMGQRGGKGGTAAAQPLSVSQPYQILQAGFAADFARCDAPVRGGGACNAAYSRAGGRRFCPVHGGGGGGGGNGGVMASALVAGVGGKGGALAAAAGAQHHQQQQHHKPSLPNRGPTFQSVGRGRGGGGGGLIVRPAGAAPTGGKGNAVVGAGKPGPKKVQAVKSLLSKSQTLSYKDGWKGEGEKGTKKPPASTVQAFTLVPRVMVGAGAGEGEEPQQQGCNAALARAQAEDDPRRDGSVLVPGESRLFAKGADAVKLAAYKHQQHVAREQRMQQRYALEDRRNAQARSQATEALVRPSGGGGGGLRGAMRGTITLAPGAVAVAPVAATAAAAGAAKGKQQQRRGALPPPSAPSMTAEEADRLMKTKSKHAAEARVELQEQMESVFESLAEKEERQEHAKAVSAVDIDAFHCQKCDRIWEKWPKLCREQGHRVQPLKTKKRFFVCANGGCGGQASLVGPGMHPKEACGKCGERLWRARGKGKAGQGGGDGGKGGGISQPVPAIADWNRFDGAVDGLYA